MRILKRYTVQKTGNDLELLLKNHKGNGFAHLIAKTFPDMNKKGNPYFGNVYKITDAQIQMGFHYINSVNNQLQREGKPRNAKLGDRAWGNRIKGTPLVEHTPKKTGLYTLYLEAKVERVNSSKLYLIDTSEEIDKELLFPWMPKAKESSTQENLTKKVYLRDYALESIMWLRADKHEIDLRTHPEIIVYA